MIIGRIVFAGSKLSLSNVDQISSLWEICGIEGKIDVDKHCYGPMDLLLNNQEKIQKKLAKKHLADKHLVLYDITSTYFEGEYDDSELVKYGYNRDKKQGFKQIVIGLICTKDGCPIATKAGNTKDESTVKEKMQEIKDKYGINKFTFVGDRGMFTKDNIAFASNCDVNFITALKRHDLEELINKKNVQLLLFPEEVCEYEIEDNGNKKRYVICRNPIQADKNTKSRQKIIEKITQKLEHIKN